MGLRVNNEDDALRMSRASGCLGTASTLREASRSVRINDFNRAKYFSMMGTLTRLGRFLGAGYLPAETLQPAHDPSPRRRRVRRQTRISLQRERVFWRRESPSLRGSCGASGT
jgi:hypothetical protein